MVILDLGICLDIDSKVRRFVWGFLVKVRKFKDWKFERFDQA